MESFDISKLKDRARERLARASYSPKKLILIYTAVMLGVGILISLISLLISFGMENTGGLGGMGSRAILETITTLLQLAHMLVLPFWQIGLVFAAVKIIRGQRAEPDSLLEGFRRFGSVLRMNVLRTFIYFAVIMLASQVGSFLYMLTPLSAKFYTMMEEVSASGVMDPDALMSEEILNELMRTYMPLMLVVALAALIPVMYRLRMMDYAIMDRPELGARFALQLSLYMTRKQCKKLFLLDLRFWWFYLLELLAVAVSWGDVWLPLLGVQLGMDEQVASFLFLCAGTLVQFALYAWKQDLLATTYAAAYESLLPPPPETDDKV